jgi:hypothetical protein
MCLSCHLSSWEYEAFDSQNIPMEGTPNGSASRPPLRVMNVLDE